MSSRFLVVPLTPVHVGDGTTLAPETFLIDGNDLVRFRAEQVLADMDKNARARFLAALDAGQLKDAQGALRRAVRPEHHVERVPAAPESRKYLRNAVENPDQSGKASPFVRSGGRPYLPGSSIKGAFRTALVDAFAHDGDHRPQVEARIGTHLGNLPRNQNATGRHSDTLQQIALDCPPGATERDPLRYLHVGDATLPERATRFDKVTVGWSPKKSHDSDKGRQLHVERLWCFADGDGEHVAAGTLDLAVTGPERQAEARSYDKGKTPARGMVLDAVLAAARDFHERRWQAEIARFFPGRRETFDRLRARLERELRQAAGTDARPPVLLRIGRFGHFESKSVDDWRRGWQAMPKPGRHMKEGSSRAVVQGIADLPLPFGWALLCLETPGLAAWARERAPAKAPASAPSQPTSGRPQPGPGGSPLRRGQAASLAGRRGAVGGEPVTVIEDLGAKLWVEFEDGPDHVNRDDFEPD